MNIIEIRHGKDADVLNFIIDDDGDEFDFCYRADDTISPLTAVLTQYLADNDGQYTVLPYDAPPPPPYRISKSTPWIRMTDDEAELITGAMQQAPSRQKGIYDAATYLSSDDPLWGALHDMIAATLGSSSRADELLAPET